MQALPTITLTENQPQNVSLPIGVTAVQIHNASVGFLTVSIGSDSTYVGPQSWVTIPVGGQTTLMTLTLQDASSGSVYATVFMATDGNLPNSMVAGSLNQQKVVIDGGVTLEFPSDASVSINGTPTVDLASGSTVEIGGTPTVDLASGANVEISGTPTIVVDSGNIAISNSDNVAYDVTQPLTVAPGVSIINYLISIPTSNPPTHAYLLQVVTNPVPIPESNPMPTGQGLVQVQALWWTNQINEPQNFFYTDPLTVSPQLNMGNPCFLLSSVIPASVISSSLLLQVWTNSTYPEDSLQLNISIQITGYTATIPFTTNDVDYNGLTAAQNTSLPTTSSGVTLTDANTQYTIITNPSTSANNIKICSFWATGTTTVFILYTPFDTNGIQITVLNTSTISMPFLLTPGSTIKAYCTESETNAGVTYTYI
jgi:hypothetical protein